MKKFSLFILSLLFTVGAVAQIDVNKEYRLKDSSTGKYLNALNHEAHQSGPQGGVNVADMAESYEQIFTFEASGSGYYLKTKSGYYIKCQPWNVDACSTSDKTLLTFEPNNNGYYIKWDNKNMNQNIERDDYFMCGTAENDNSGTRYVYCDAAVGSAATWMLEPVGPDVYTLKVLGASASVTYNGQAYNDGSAIEIVGAVSKSQFAPSAVAGKISIVSIDGKTVYASYFDASQKFYTIKNKNAGYLSLNAGYMSGSDLKLSNTSAPADTKGLWAFIEQSSGVYKIYNYSTGLSKAIGMTGSEDAARAMMVDPETTAYTTNFDGIINFGSASTGSYIRLNGTSNNYWNLRNQYLALWDSPDAVNDNGSTFYLEEANYTDYPEESHSEYEVSNITGISNFVPKNPNTLWYTTSAPATGVSNPWQEYALPLGNGELGCMVFGGVHNEELQFNEKTLWSGPANTVGADHSNRTFVNFGSLFIRNNDEAIWDGVTDYVRYLDIEEGVAGVEFKNAKGSKHVRKYLSSAPDQVIVGNYTIEGDDKLNLLFTIKPCSDIGATAVTYKDNSASFTGAMEVVKYAARFHVVADEGATITASGAGVSVRNAKEVTFYLKGATNFNGDMTVLNNYFTTETAEEVNNRVKSEIENAIAKGYDTIEAAHIEDFTSITKRMTFDLGLETPKVDTKTLVDKYYPNNQNANSMDNDHLFLEQLYFHYGRYLAISSNRKPIAAPNNLQGIWNNLGRQASDGVWNSDIHTNINIQMNYWPTEITNLSDLHKPFLNFIIRGAQSEGWKKVGEQYNDGHGWSVLTESSLYNSMSTWGSNYLVANVWYTSHLWMHYRYTLDKEFLKQAFPVMWSCAEFWFHRLKNVNGEYLAPNEYSPEHGPGHNNTTGEDGTAHAQQMISNLFQNLKEAVEILGAKELGLSDEQVAKLNEYCDKTDKGLATESCTIANNGVGVGTTLLREWKYSPHSTGQLGHRHMSHLMALYPMDQITPESEFFTPAVNSLRHRGDEATGWSMGWKVNLWARAQDGDHAHVIIKNALQHAGGNGGVYYNLFDAHPPFQIDGNFGVCSGIAEMLMQSAHGYINILPALPAVWEKTGNVRGMKAIGNFTVDFSWSDGECNWVRITSHAGAELRVRCTRGAKSIADAKVYVDGNEVSISADEHGIATIPCEKGSVVGIEFKEYALNIDEVLARDALQSPVYDISGRRITEVGNNQLYIQNGVKKLAK